MNIEQIKQQSYLYWCKRLQKHLHLNKMPYVKEYKDELGYKNMIYKKLDLSPVVL